MTSTIEELVSADRSLVSGEAYSPEVYRRELEAIFATTWLFLGHVDHAPSVGDYHTTWMGEVPIVFLRDETREIHAFVNRCSASGRHYLSYDFGNTHRIVCPTHRVAYDLRGQVIEPRGDGQQTGSCLGAVSRLEIYGGLIFGSLAESGISLADHLGEARWYLDNYLLREDIGGLALVDGFQRYRMPGNWKLLAENFAGDDFHVAITHASVIGLRSQGIEPRLVNSPGRRATDPTFSVATGYPSGVPHGLLEVRVGNDFYAHDLARAKTISPRAEEWVRTRKEAVDRRLPDLPAKPYGFHVGNVFPTMSIIGNGTALEAVGLLVWHPRGPFETSVNQYCFVDAEAPRELQEQMVWALTHQQSAAGIFAPDDHENFERLAENLTTHQAKKLPFNYEMGIASLDRDVRPKEWQHPGWPGLVVPQFTELIHREFYRYWQSLMAAERSDGDG